MRRSLYPRYAEARLLELAAGQTTRLANVSELAGPFQLSRPTIRNYVALLERMFVLEFVPLWHSNRLSRLAKDAQAALGRQASWREEKVGFHHYRDRDGHEVDIVLQRDDGRVAGIEVKAAGTVGEKDFRGLKRLAAAAGKHFAAGVVLYDGENTLPLGPHLHAVPVRALWDTP